MMISWNSFKDATPKQDVLDKCDNQILICENSFGFAGMPTKFIYISSFRSGSGCYTNETGDYKNPDESTEEVFWSYLNKP